MPCRGVSVAEDHWRRTGLWRLMYDIGPDKPHKLKPKFWVPQNDANRIATIKSKPFHFVEQIMRIY